jgi:hypothetical protein
MRRKSGGTITTIERAETIVVRQVILEASVHLFCKNHDGPLIINFHNLWSPNVTFECRKLCRSRARGRSLENKRSDVMSRG